MRSIAEWLAIPLVALIVAYPLLGFQNLNAQMQQYYITTTLLGRDPRISQYSSPSNSTIHIYEKVFDEYGKIKHEDLVYCVGIESTCENEKAKSWNNRTMLLIDGTASNGTYLGLIPPQKNGSTVNFDTVFKDDLGYTNNFRYPDSFNTFGVIGPAEKVQPNVQVLLNEQGIPDQLRIYAWVLDYNNTGNLNSVTANYMVTPELSKVSKPNYTPVSMNFLTFFPPSLRVYEATIKANKMFDGEKIWLYFTLTDALGHRSNDNPAPEYLHIPRYRPIAWNTTFSSVDINNQTAHIKFSFYDPSVNVERGRDLPYLHSNVTCTTRICIGVDLLQNNTVKDKVLIPIKDSIDCRGYGYIAVYNLPSSKFQSLTPSCPSFPLRPWPASFTLIGDPSEFPFDQYSLRLRLVIPYNSQNINYSNQYSNSIYSILNPSFHNTTLPGYTTLHCNGSESSNESSWCGMDSRIISDEKPNLQIISFDFKRNYTVAVIIIPMLAIFYLLGAVFILESTTEQLPIRLAITLGIFAFLFTFTPIINQIKPATVTKVPTVADSLVTIILVATIAFSVSSVVSGSPVFRKNFPLGSVWIDRIVFFVISGIIIGYFWHYPFDIKIWIVPLIIFGLGYGLILRTRRGKEKGTKITDYLKK